MASAGTRGALSRATGVPGTNHPPGLETSSLNAAVSSVTVNASVWAATPPAARADLLDRVLSDTQAVSEDWLADACRAKGLRPGSPEAGEELFAGVVAFVRMARLLRDSVRQIGRSGRPHYPGPVTEAADGRVRVGVFPAAPADRVLFSGVSAEIWMSPG